MEPAGITTEPVTVTAPPLEEDNEMAVSLPCAALSEMVNVVEAPVTTEVLLGLIARPGLGVAVGGTVAVAV